MMKMNGPSVQSGITGGVGKYLSPEITPWSGGDMWAQIGQLAASAVPSIFSYLTGRQGQSSQSSQSAAALAQADRQWREQFGHMQQLRDDQLERDKLARDEAAAQFLALEQQKQAQWQTKAGAALPYQHASAMILGQTMGMNVPAIRSRYSTAEGVEPEPNPYGPFIYS
jgi:hypothetical protein